MKLTVFRGQGQENYMLSMEFSPEHGLTAHARIGNPSYIDFSAHDVTLEELEAIRAQLGDAITKAIHEGK